jgi:hypothetical protein
MADKWAAEQHLPASEDVGPSPPERRPIIDRVPAPLGDAPSTGKHLLSEFLAHERSDLSMARKPCQMLEQQVLHDRGYRGHALYPELGQ